MDPRPGCSVVAGAGTNHPPATERRLSGRAGVGIGRYQGRGRRADTGLAHHRPLKRHAPRASRVAGTTTTGRGQSASIAATMAAASSAVGPGRIDTRRDAPGAGDRRGPTRPSAHRGMFPCLRRGSSSRFVLSMARPAMSLLRVSAGSMTSST